MPGLYSHVFIFCGRVVKEQPIWDRDNSRWMDLGTPYVIHSSARNKSHMGLGYSAWTSRVNHYGSLVKSIRITQVNQSQRIEALNWMIGKLIGGSDGFPVGPTYDWGWSHKQISGTNPLSNIDGYYCSEIIWAAYKDLFGIDLDPDGNNWDLTTLRGVSPTELLESKYSEEIPMYFGKTPEIDEDDQITSTVCMWADINNNTFFSADELINQCNTTFSANSSELPLGFIQNVMGLTLAERKEFVILADVDENGDGIDDRTKGPILGFKSGEYAKKSLKYEVEIKKIDGISLFDIPTKSLILPEPIETPYDTTTENETSSISEKTNTNTSTGSSSDDGEKEIKTQKIIGFRGLLGISSFTILIYGFFQLFQGKRKNIH